MTQNPFKSGFVSIVGKPNVGKSTLMNRLVGENLSIVSPKAQTTRHRIMGIINGDNYQIVYSDTPGILEPKYSLHQAMMNYVKVSLILLLVDPVEKYDPLLFDKLNRTETPVILVINKADLGKGSQVEDKATYWKEHLQRVKTIIPVSALRGDNVPELLNIIVDNLPEHPAYFPVDELTDRPQRFFASEILREKIFLNYEQEVPYSTEVVITDFIEQDGVLRIRAEIFVERDSQKGIIIGKAGSALKKVGTEARQSMEEFFQTRVFLETKVKVAKNWRREQGRLKQFGYGL
jgi:GTP-binding protein Era